MSCFVGIILIAGIGINPCNITRMHTMDPTKDGNAFCYIEFNSGNAWSGTDNVMIHLPCEAVIAEINKAKGRKQ